MTCQGSLQDVHGACAAPRNPYGHPHSARPHQLLRPPHEVYALDLGIDSAMPLRHPQHIGLAHAGSAHIVGHTFGVHGTSISATISHHFVKEPSALAHSDVAPAMTLKSRNVAIVGHTRSGLLRARRTCHIGR